LLEDLGKTEFEKPFVCCKSAIQLEAGGYHVTVGKQAHN
jgi:hypothetical protein